MSDILGPYGNAVESVSISRGWRRLQSVLPDSDWAIPLADLYNTQWLDSDGDHYDLTYQVPVYPNRKVAGYMLSPDDLRRISELLQGTDIHPRFGEKVGLILGLHAIGKSNHDIGEMVKTSRRYVTSVLDHPTAYLYKREYS